MCLATECLLVFVGVCCGIWSIEKIVVIVCATGKDILRKAGDFATKILIVVIAIIAVVLLCIFNGDCTVLLLLMFIRLLIWIWNTLTTLHDRQTLLVWSHDSKKRHYKNQYPGVLGCDSGLWFSNVSSVTDAVAVTVAAINIILVSRHLKLLLHIGRVRHRCCLTL